MNNPIIKGLRDGQYSLNVSSNKAAEDCKYHIVEKSTKRKVPITYKQFTSLYFFSSIKTKTNAKTK